MSGTLGAGLGTPAKFGAGLLAIVYQVHKTASFAI